MYVLAINGSPRVGGNTDILLNHILEGAKSKGAIINKIQLARLKINFCKECNSASIKSLCTTKDDMRVIFKRIKDSDVVIIGSPIFFGSLTAQLKAVIDRFQCFWIAKHIFKKNLFKDNKKRVGIFVSCAAGRRKDFFNNAKLIVKNFFATSSIEYKYELFCGNVDKKGEILKYPGILKKAYSLGTKLIV